MKFVIFSFVLIKCVYDLPYLWYSAGPLFSPNWHSQCVCHFSDIKCDPTYLLSDLQLCSLWLRLKLAPLITPVIQNQTGSMVDILHSSFVMVFLSRFRACPLAQRVCRSSHNPFVPGSRPISAAVDTRYLRFLTRMKLQYNSSASVAH